MKSGRKNSIEVTLNLSSNVIGHSNDGTNFSHKLLLTIDKFRSFVKLLQKVYQLI